MPIDKRGETRIRESEPHVMFYVYVSFSLHVYFLCGEKSTLDQMIFMVWIQQRIY